MLHALAHSDNVREVLIVNGLERGNVTRALAGRERGDAHLPGLGKKIGLIEVK